MSLNRIEEFMLCEEVNQENKKKRKESTKSYDSQATVIANPEFVRPRSSDPSVVVENFNARWNKNASELSLNNINFSVDPGKMIAIVGPVGSGKSSLFQAILGELPAESGSVRVNGRVSYASQEP